MSKKTKKETVVADSVSNEQNTQQPVVEQPAASGSPADNHPAYVKELLEKGVVVLSGRSREELAEMLKSIPADLPYYTGAVAFYYDKGLYRLQVNRKEE